MARLSSVRPLIHAVPSDRARDQIPDQAADKHGDEQDRKADDEAEQRPVSIAALRRTVNESPKEHQGVQSERNRGTEERTLRCAPSRSVWNCVLFGVAPVAEVPLLNENRLGALDAPSTPMASDERRVSVAAFRDGFHALEASTAKGAR